MKEARFYEKLEEDRVRCLLCPHHCKISPGRTGICRVRQNAGGVLCTLNYGQVTSWAVDPIEKKPLYHFYPGSQIFSVGTFGCNFHCGFCQNWQIAHKTPPTEKISPEELVRIAVDAGKRAGSIGIAYTYSEPNVWFEYVYDTAKLAHEHGLKNVLVTNGFIEEEPLQELLPFIDAMNIDVKAFSERFYKEVCHGHLAPVLRTVEIAHQQCHVEITNLLVPTENDREEEIESLVDWIASIDRAIPLHFSRYFPQYKFTLPPTPLETLKKAREVALRRLQFVYIGNAWELGENDTFCPVCGNLLIKRSGYKTRIAGLEGNRCSKCGAAIPVVV
jgi:pyruvate formate lyase activating enzyme